MPTTSWNKGYVADIAYTAGFYPDQAPAHLDFIAVLNGFEPMAPQGPMRYLELGCGQGLTSCLLAATNPAVEFHAVDFNPAHIAGARELAAASGLGNVQFIERSFEELLERGPPLPEFDAITLHGIYSWIGAEARRAIVELIRRQLKPGGMVYVSYNAMPGWTQALPIQRMLYELAALAEGRSDRRLEQALGFARRMRGVKARFFAEQSFLDQILEQWEGGYGVYLAHELLNEHWRPLYHADVARELAEAKLGFVGSSAVLENFPEIALSPEERELLAAVEESDLKETLKDFFLARLLRKDVYVRGPRRLSRARQDALMRELELALVVPRARARFSFTAGRATASIEEAVYGPIFDALALRPRAVGELLALSEVRERSKMQAVELAGMLVGSLQALPVPRAGPSAPPAAKALNRVVAARAREAPLSAMTALAAERLGTGLHVSGVEAHVYDELARGTAPDTAVLARALWRTLAERGERILKDGKPLEFEADSLALLEERAQVLLTEILPLWRGLGVI